MIKNIKVLPKKLKILFSNNKEDNFLNLWLRDHARDEASWDSRSNQRKIHTAKLDPNLYIKKATIKENGKSVDILWSDLVNPINYSADFFEENSQLNKKKISKIKIWKKKEITDEIYVNFEDTLSDIGFVNFLNKYTFSYRGM